MSISIRNFLSTLLVLTLSLGGASHLRAADRASTIFERAKEAFARNDYVDAEWLSLCATSDAKKTNPFATNKVILALELAGLSASSLHEHVRAITYFSEGEALAGKSRDLLEWARIVHELAQSLIRRGENPQAEWRLRQAIGVRNEKLGLAHPDTLESMSSLATLFDLQGKFALAEAGHRSVYTNRVRIFGGDHPSTLTSQHNLYAAVFHKGEYVLAGIGLRELIKRRSRGLGAEHPDTLASRKMLADVMNARNLFPQAEVEYQAVSEIRGRVLGPEHPDALATRTNLPAVLRAQGKIQEAEAEEEAISEIQKRIGSTIKPAIRVSPSEFATKLFAEGRFAEAEAEFRALLKIQLTAARFEDPLTLKSLYVLAICLKEQGKMEEAQEFARWATEGAHKNLGAENPDTKDFEKLYQGLSTKR